MRTVLRPTLLALSVALASATASRAASVVEGGFEAPAAAPVLEDGGYRTGTEVTDIGGAFLTPAASDLSFDERLAYVRRSLLRASDDATCAPARLETRLQRRLRRVVAKINDATDAPADEMVGHLARAATLLRGYCATVLGADSLRPDCAAVLRRPCPVVSDSH